MDDGKFIKIAERLLRQYDAWFGQKFRGGGLWPVFLRGTFNKCDRYVFIDSNFSKKLENLFPLLPTRIWFQLDKAYSLIYCVLKLADLFEEI